MTAVVVEDEEIPWENAEGDDTEDVTTDVVISDELPSRGTKRKQETEDDEKEPKRRKKEVLLQYTKEGRAFHKCVTNIVLQTPKKRLKFNELVEKITSIEDTNKIWEQFHEKTMVDFETSLEFFGTRYIFDMDTETNELYVSLNPFREAYYPPINNIPFGHCLFDEYIAGNQKGGMSDFNNYYSKQKFMQKPTPSYPQLQPMPKPKPENNGKYPYVDEITGALITSELMENRFLNGKKYKRKLREWQKKQQFNKIEELKRQLAKQQAAEAEAKALAEAKTEDIDIQNTSDSNEPLTV